MFHKQGRALSRIATVMLASSLAVGSGFAMAGTAGAEGADSPNASGALAKLVSGKVVTGGKVVVKGTTHEFSLTGGLFVMKTDSGQELQTYCIDFQHDTRDNSDYQETGWDATSLATNPDKGKILWVLENSYPKISVDKLNGLGLGGTLTPETAAAATQAAIWHYSDKLDAHPADATGAKLTDYLEAHATTLEEPKPSLSLAPQEVSGKSGDKLGPITVSTTAADAQLSLDATSAAAGAVVVDEANNVLSDKTGKITKKVKSGDKLYVKTAPGAKAGKATITATTSTSVQVGRAFISLGYTPAKHSQTMILAGSDTLSVSAKAAANWAPTGPIPAVTAKVECAQGAVVVTATNNGDQDFTFTLAGKTVTVKPGGTQSVPVKVEEGQAYDITVTGPNGFSKEFKGILNCKVASTTTGGSTPPATTTGGGLASTGGGGATPILAGLAGALVIAGGAAVFALRRRGRHSRTAA